MAEKKKTNPVASLIVIIIFGWMIWYFYGGGLQHATADRMTEIQGQVASDAVAQYRIANRSGNPMDACVQAGFVAAAYLQSQDEGNYQQWKQTEKVDCAAAGIHK